MGIREARVSDWKEIRGLLKQLDYGDTDSFLEDKIKTCQRRNQFDLIAG